MRLLLDANIFLNVIFKEEHFLETSRRLLKQIETIRLDASISSVTLAEIIWVVHKESGFKKAREFQSYLREFSELQIIKIVSIEEDVVYRMLRLVSKYGLSLVDALIVSTAIATKSDLVTRDDRIKRIKELESESQTILCE